MIAALLLSASLRLERMSAGYVVRLPLGKSVGRFIIDTGSPDCYATSAGRALLLAAGGKAGHDGTVTIGGLRLGTFATPPLAFFSDERSDNPITERGPDGILGLSLLARYRVGLDLGAGELRLWPRTTPVEGAVREWFGRGMPAAVWSAPLTLGRDGTYYVPVRLDGRVVSLCLDTGTGCSFVSAPMARILGWSREVSRSPDRYAGRATTHVVYDIERLGIGERDLAGRPRFGAMETPAGDPGILGFDAMLSVRILLDFSDGRIYLSER